MSPSTQEKFQHFEQADEKKFREVWEMNEAEVRGLMTKVLEAERKVAKYGRKHLSCYQHQVD